MYPLVIKIGSVQLNPIWLGILAFMLLFIYILWRLQKGRTKESKIFDIAFTVLIVAFLLNRLFIVITDFNYFVAEGWSWLPFQEYYDPALGNQIIWFYGLPWSALLFTPGKTLFISVFIGIIIGTLLFFLSAKRFNKIYEVLDDIVLAYAVAVIPLLLAMHFAAIYVGKDAVGLFAINFPDGIERYPLQIFQILYMLGFVGLIYWLRFHKKLSRVGLSAGLFLLVHGLCELLLRYLSANYDATILNTFDFYQLLALILVLFGLFLLLGISQEYSAKKNSERSLNKQKLIRSINNMSSAEARNRFNMSFSKFSKVNHNNNSAERFARYTSSLKRKFSTVNREKDEQTRTDQV